MMFKDLPADDLIIMAVNTKNITKRPAQAPTTRTKQTARKLVSRRRISSRTK